MTQTPPGQTPPGWYPQGGVQRWWDGSQWTEHTQPLAQQGFQPQPKKSHTGRNILLGIVGFVVLIIVIAAAASGGGSDSSSKKDDPFASSDNSSGGSSGGSSSKQNGSGGLDATAGHENQIKQGAGFRLGDFRIMPGWKVAKEDFTGWTVNNLVVKNVTDSAHDFTVDIRLLQGQSRVTADITCSINNQANAGQVYDVDCFPTGKSAGAWNRITITNTF